MELYDINRYALIVTPSEALLRWAIREDPTAEDEIDFDDTSDLTTVYLLPDFGDIDEAEEWLEKNYRTILENLLSEWVEDESNWPSNLAFNHFEKFSDYTITNMVIDTQDASYDEE
ncbi:hypothetical protein CLV84_1629 [Neolewinella xylanilytica]|uniref:Uncharacterized protein n=1 Tax=Neolewinella xylanilytica TaxID=1514080 RepID=A0A2S6IB31_9BACT|nr:hypothetical protein [Neolewinella xylanilytica]PPK88659.1 hypothetical protein CLV84_1629 [Neolewinella xylanilytica]